MSAPQVNAATCPRCGGRLLRDLELGIEAIGTDRVMKCINCGHVPGQGRAPTSEEQATSHYRPAGYTPRPVAEREFAGRLGR